MLLEMEEEGVTLGYDNKHLIQISVTDIEEPLFSKHCYQ